MKILTEISVNNRLTFRIERTSWADRLIVWPGKPFHTLPFPFLFHRFDVLEYHLPYFLIPNWCGSFFRYESARTYLRTLIEEEKASQT